MNMDLYMNIMNKNEITEISTAIELINNNYNMIHRWFNVRNESGCIFSIHGTSKQIEIILPKHYYDGEQDLYINEYSVSTTKKRIPLDNDKKMNREQFIQYISNNDFVKNPIKINSRIMMVERRVFSVDLGL